MKFFNFFKKRAPKNILSEINNIPTEISLNYQKLIEITKILTENDAEAINSINMLVNSSEEFEKTNSEWLEMVDFSVKNEPELITAFWLTGYDSPYNYGSYIDWKEDSSEIIWSLEESVKNKRYALNLTDISFSENDFTDEALFKINSFLNEKGFVLACWNTGSDSYHLYIIKDSDYTELVSLGKDIHVEFYSFKEDN